MSQSFFRKQSIESRKQRLHGNVLILPRPSHVFLLGCLSIWLVLLIFWMFSGTYTRKETVFGWLEPPEGVVKVYAETSGIVESILIKEGDYVKQDQILMVIRSDAEMSSGKQLSSNLLSESELQRGLVEQQLAAREASYIAQQNGVDKEVQGIAKEIRILESQLETNRERYRLMEEKVDRIRALVTSGHASQSELNNALEQLLILKGQGQSLMGYKVSNINALEQIKTKKQLLPDEKANAVALLQEKLGDITKEITKLKAQKSYILRASRDGAVNNLQAHMGQQVTAGSKLPLLTLSSNEAALRVHLLIPVRSAGFIGEGLKINIRYDAFPYQKFGIYEAITENVSKTIILPNELIGAPVEAQGPAYIVTARLIRPDVSAYGMNFSLRPGMTLSADIKLGERSIIQWLLDPIYSLKGRI